MVALSTAGLFSCVREVIDSNTSTGNRQIEISVCQGEEKTYGDSWISFEPDDSLSVFDNVGRNCIFTQGQSGQCATRASFYGEVSEGAAPKLALYPFDKDATVSYGKDNKSGTTEVFGREYTTVSTVMPKHFEARFPNSVLHGAAVALGWVNDDNVTKTALLKNVIGLGGINIPDNILGVHNVRFSSLEGKHLHGQLKLCFKDNVPFVQSISEGGCSLDFDALRAPCDSIVSGCFYFPIIPDVYTGIQLEISLLDGTVIEKKSYIPFKMARSHCTLLGTLKLDDIQKAPAGPLDLSLDFRDNGSGHCTSLFRTIGEQTNYLPPSSEPDYCGATYYFRDGDYCYPLYIFSSNARKSLSHSWDKSDGTLLLQGGATDAFISTPPVPGKKLSAVRLSTPSESIFFSIVLKDHRTLRGTSGEWLSISDLNIEEGQPARIYFEKENVRISGFDFKYDETDIPQKDLPQYYHPYIDDKAAQIRNLASNQSIGFFFWTDTHLDANYLQTPSLINYLTHGIKDIPVFWGGDGNTAYCEDPFAIWAKHKALFSELNAGTSILLAHGNHDIHAPLSKDATTGHWMSKTEVFKEFSSLLPSTIVRNEEDKSGLYYYYDAPHSLVRFIFLDTFDNFSASGGAQGHGVNSGFSQVQFDWIFKTAVLKAPRNYKLVFVSHCNPVTSTYSAHKSLKSAIKALVSHEDYEGLKFSDRPDLDILLTIGGHCHHDMQISCNGCWNVMTTCDARYGDATRNPFVDPSSARVKGTVTEQAFDYVSVADDYSSIAMVRIGDGGDRIYHCGATHIKIGESIKLSAAAAATWEAYDSDSYLNETWVLGRQVAIVSMDGTVTGLSAGESEIVAIDSNHNLELFSVIVDEDTPVINLSESGSANCYQISESGKYKLDASLKGNGSESIKQFSSAELLWDENNSIGGVYMNGKYIYFSAVEPFRDGNALVAVKDDTGHILWSWHIWCTQAGYKGQVYGNSAGIVMDRNLGAFNNSFSADSHGLFYQWGRKDPFQHHTASYTVISDNTKGTIEYSISHPTVLICRSNISDDWLYGQDNNRWSERKTVYDPCPYGWKVPSGRLWVNTCKSRTLMFKCGNWKSEGGMDFSSAFSTKDKCIYPASGMLSGTDGSLKYSGEAGFWWAVGTESSREAGLMISDRNYVIPVCFGRADGQKIRCIKE